MAADPDPPATAGNPPPFTSNDVRISPSGPYVAGAGGGLVRYGCDAIVQALGLTSNGGTPSPVPRRLTPSEQPLAVTFPSFDDGDTLWIVWHLSGGWIAGGDPAPTQVNLSVVPTVDVGSGPEFIDGSEVLWVPGTTIAGDAQAVSIAGTAAIKLTNITQPPIVQLFYALDDNSGGGSQIAVRGVGPAEAAGSCWLTVAEISKTAVFQFPAEVHLSPFT